MANTTNDELLKRQARFLYGELLCEVDSVGRARLEFRDPGNYSEETFYRFEASYDGPDLIRLRATFWPEYDGTLPHRPCYPVACSHGVRHEGDSPRPNEKGWKKMWTDFSTSYNAKDDLKWNSQFRNSLDLIVALLERGWTYKLLTGD